MRCPTISSVKYIHKCIFCLALLFCSCSTTSLLTPDHFNAVAVGASMAQVEEIYGAPYDVKRLPNGIEEYRYIQRICVNQTVADQIEYVFIVRNGRIIDKQRRQIGCVAPLQIQS